jgi:putative membrane protein
VKWLAHVAVNAVLLLALAGYFQSIHLSGVGAALLASALLSVLNTFVKPVFVLLTLPLTVFTFGLFLFVINAFTLWLVSWLMGDSFAIAGFSSALWASLAISLFHVVMDAMMDRD